MPELLPEELFLKNVLPFLRRALCVCGAGSTRAVPWPWALPGELCDPGSLAAVVSKQELPQPPPAPALLRG